MPVPMDVKLMNTTSLGLGLAFVGMLVAFGMSWLLQQNFFRLTAIRVGGDLNHNTAVTLRANVVPKLTGNFFTVDLPRAQAAFRTQLERQYQPLGGRRVSPMDAFDDEHGQNRK